MALALLTLLHVLIFVYWLGGDLGAFYAARIIAAPDQAVAARLAAARVLGAVDMAPRTSLILTLPTGLTLASAKGWMVVPSYALAAVWAVSLAWLAIAWAIHLRHLEPRNPWRRLDLIIRWVTLIVLAGAGAAIAFDVWSGPLFVGVKLIILASAIATGLWVRVVFAPFGPAFSAVASGQGTPELDAQISATIARVRPAVIAIWIQLLVAAFFGLWTPL